MAVVNFSGVKIWQGVGEKNRQIALKQQEICIKLAAHPSLAHRDPLQTAVVGDVPSFTLDVA